MKNKFFFLILSICLIHCKNEPAKQLKETAEGKHIHLKYAKGFSIKDHETYKILVINKPWPDAKKSYRFALLKNNYKADYEIYEKQRLENTIELPIKKIVVTSTTHIPALELLNVEHTLVGFPGIDYVSSEKTRKRIEDNLVRELGKNEGINTEILLDLKPDLVVGFGIDGNNRSLEIIKKSGIPVIFNGDWVESSPLAKAEWIKFFGALYNKEKQADSIFNVIEKNYLEAKKLAINIKDKPSVLSGAMHNDVWYLPNGESTEAQILKDANVNYLWNDTNGSGSLQLNFESVFAKAKDADIWLSPSNYNSLESLKNGSSLHTMFKPFQNKNVYSFTNTTGASGGVLYYELGMTRPDLVLKDIIKICHPELLKNHTLYFFKPLK